MEKKVVVNKIYEVEEIGYWESLRHKYIGLAMLGIFSQGIDTPPSIAKYAVSYADAIIEKLKKEQHE